MGTDESADLVVIGTGSAGMAAALRAVELGGRVRIIESGTIGGTCVNVGCIPSKHLVSAAETVNAARRGFPGVVGCDPRVEWSALLEWKSELVAELRGKKYEDVLASRTGIDLMRGRARLVDTGWVEVDGARHAAPKVVIAAGTQPWIPELPGLDGIEVLTSTTAMEVAEPPASLLVLGGNAVGVELAQVFSRFGTQVTVLELLPRLLAAEDAEASADLQEALEQEGIEVHTATTALRVERSGAGIVVHARTLAGERAFRSERLLAATGRRPRLADMGLESAGVQLDARGFVRVDAGMRTSNPDVFAAGDVTGGPGFVYVAAAAGRVAAENAMLSGSVELDVSAVPRVTFTSPQVAAVGITAAEAEAAGLAVEATRLALEHVPRALVEHRRDGWVKMVAESGTRRILGVHAIGPNAAELLGEATLAVRKGLTVEDLVETMHPYLTWVEAMKLVAQSFTTDVAQLSCCA